jgi:hypothetical protein
MVGITESNVDNPCQMTSWDVYNFRFHHSVVGITSGSAITDKFTSSETHSPGGWTRPLYPPTWWLMDCWYKDFHSSAMVKYAQMTGFLVLGRLFLRLYLSALYFFILTRVRLFDILTNTMSPRRRIQIVAVILALASWTYGHFNLMIYGNLWT